VNTSGQHTCGVTTSNVAYCWGYNVYGQLGNGTTTQSTSPVQVSGGLAFQELQTNQYSVCALTTTGKGYCWGNSNGHGTLGNAVTSNETTPVAMSTGTTFQTLGTGKNFGQCAVARAGGAPWCWGLGSSGQLGTGFTSDAVTAPYKVLNP
jgi:alpha-tubulin suppressor-like RCC1 family protein